MSTKENILVWAGGEAKKPFCYKQSLKEVVRLLFWGRNEPQDKCDARYMKHHPEQSMPKSQYGLRNSLISFSWYKRKLRQSHLQTQVFLVISIVGGIGSSAREINTLAHGTSGDLPEPHHSKPRGTGWGSRLQTLSQSWSPRGSPWEQIQRRTRAFRGQHEIEINA